MSLSVNPVSNLSFRSQEINMQTREEIEDFLKRPGTYNKPEAAPVEKPAKKKHTLLKVVLGTLAAAVAVAGIAYGLRANYPKIFKKTRDIANLTGGMDKFKAYLTTGIAYTAQYVNIMLMKSSRAIASCWDSALKFLKIRSA